MPLHGLHHRRGFVLTEWLLIAAVAAVILSLGFPALERVIADARRTATVNTLVGHIQLARSEAARRNAPVVLCKADEQRRCAASTGRWEHGWLVLVAAGPSRPNRLTGTRGILAEHRPESSGVHVAANRQAFVFNVDSRSTNGTLVVCDRRGTAQARAIIVSFTGRPRISHRTAGGQPLQCPPAEGD